MIQSEEKKRSEVKSLDRAIKILDCFTIEGFELSLKEISEKAGLAKSTTHRLLHSLEKNLYIEQYQVGGKYRLGIELARLGEIAKGGISLRTLALCEMQKLSASSGQTSNLYVLKGAQRVCVEQVEGPNYVRRFSFCGAVFPLYAGAGGRIFLAYMTQSARQEYYKEAGKELKKEGVLVDFVRLEDSVSKILEDGYVYTRGERDPITASVAAPIFDYHGHMVAAVTVSGPIEVFNAENVQRFVPMLLDSTAKISRKLGYKTNTIASD